MPGLLSAIGTGIGQGVDQVGNWNAQAAQIALAQQALRQQQQQMAWQQQQQQQEQQMAAIAGLALPQLAAQQGQQSPFGPAAAPQTPIGGGIGGGGAVTAPFSSPVPSSSQLDRAILNIESGNRDYPPDSRTGAVGPGQIMPKTAAGYGVGMPQLRDPTINRQLSQKIVGDLSQRYGGDPNATAVGYNAGPGTADKYVASGRNPATLPPETQQYLKKLAPQLTGAAQKTLQASAANLPPEMHQEISQTAQGAAQQIDPAMYGQATLKQIVDAVEKTSPDADPATKFYAVASLSKLMAPDARMMMSLYTLQNRQAFTAQEPAGAPYKIGDRWVQPLKGGGERMLPQGAEPAVSLAGNQFMQTPGGDTVIANPRTNTVAPSNLPAGSTKAGGSQLPPELSYPDKWEGMPDKPPPGVREDVWDSTLFFSRTHQMPSFGFQPGARTLIQQAYPAALHALGIKPSEAADIAAAYAGERHGEIVGGGRAAQIGFGIEEALKAAPQVVETSKGVPRTQFPPINQFQNWLQEKSGDPNIVAFREALNTYLNVYAATVSRTGRLTDAQQRHAYDLLSTSFNQGQIDRGIEQLNYEMNLMKEAVPPAMESIKQLGQPPAMRAPQTPASPPQSTMPPGIPQGSTRTEHTYQGQPVWQAPDGTYHTPDQAPAYQ